MDEHISIREWQERFRTGTFDSDEQAGWNDFYGRMNNRRLPVLTRLVMGITDSFIVNYLLSKEQMPSKKLSDFRSIAVNINRHNYSSRAGI